MTSPDPEYVALLTQLRGLDPDNPQHDALVEQLHARYLVLARGGTTTGGLPYPDPTDPIAEGADAIRALAEAIDASRRTRFSYQQIATGYVPGGQLIGAGVAIPTATVSRRLMIRIYGLVSPQSAGDAGVAIDKTGSGAGAVLTEMNALRTYAQIGNQFYGYARSAYLSIPANQVGRIQLQTISSVLAAYQLTLETELLTQGQW